MQIYSIKNFDNKCIPVAVGKYGIRNRSEIYSKELATNYRKNKVIFKDTLIIGMGTTQIDFGVLLDDKKYCVSPAYSTYKINNINSYYLSEYLKLKNNILSKKYMIISARQGKSVNKEELMKHKFIIHSKETQNYIECILKTLGKCIQVDNNLLYKMFCKKEYLLTNLFK